MSLVYLKLFIADVLPYIAGAIFIIGTINRVINWAKSPVPLKIPTTCGQQKSLPFIRRTWEDRLDSPYTMWETIGRMILEVFLFRSLFRNTRYWLDKQKGVDTRWLWLFALLFHYSMLIIVLRHLRFFANPVPGFLSIINALDGQPAYVPALYITGILALVALFWLWARRILCSRERNISYPADHLILALVAGILITGNLMRYFFKVDLYAVKEVALGIVSFHPASAAVVNQIGWIFFLHLGLVCITIAYLPFSKVMHFAGVFFSPTRNMPNDNRAHVHVNPWNPPYHGITWQEYYEMYKDQLDEIAENGYKVKPEV